MLGAGLVVAAMGWPAWQGRAATEAPGSARRPVLVELFTSEGRSSCPPSETLLANLDAIEPIPGAQVTVLSEHVTDWNHQGWRDPYSLDSLTDRQKRYQVEFALTDVYMPHLVVDGTVPFALTDVYTPQMLADGAVQIVGTDGRKLAQVVSAAAAEPKQELTIDEASWDGDGVKFAISRERPAAGKSKTTLVAALAEDATQTSVKAGENAGRTLHKVAVVRVLKEIGSQVEDRGVLTLKLPSGDDKCAAGPLRLVVFLVD
jgi:hypothetical protein